MLEKNIINDDLSSNFKYLLYSFVISIIFSIPIYTAYATGTTRSNLLARSKKIPKSSVTIKDVKVNFNKGTFSKKTQSLECKKREIRNKIYKTKKILRQIAKKKHVSVGQLNIINSQIINKQRLTNIIKKEIVLLNTNIIAKRKQINVLNKQLRSVKIDYENMLFESVKLRNKIDKILFIFSSKSFNDLFLRIKYIDQYNEFRRKYFKKAIVIKNNLRIERIAAKNKIKKAEKLYLQYQKEQKDFLIIKKSKTAIISLLNKRTKELELEVKRYNKVLGTVAVVVKKTIAKDIKPKKPLIKTKIYSRHRKSVLLGSFFSCRGKLTWPVKSGIITKRFGKWRHPVLKRGMVENPGIDIQTEPGSIAYAIFPGVIKAVVFVPGMQQLVIVGHGKYYTVYGKLFTVKVEIGHKIEPGDPIGKIHTSTEGITELQFQIWYGQRKLNPERWLTKTY